MTVIGIVGSPRKGMNTDILVQSVLNGCQRKGASIRIVYLNDLAMRPCQACRKQDGKGCRLRDDMATVYRVFDEADGMVVGTPIYYSTVSSQMKLMIDRSYCLARPILLPSGKALYQSAVEQHKKGIVLCVAHSSRVSDHLWSIFQDWSNEINLEIVDRVFVNQIDTEREPKDRMELLEQLAQKGESLYQAIVERRMGNSDCGG